ncbi:hypothetical protein C8Q80DRAFT_519539 [Daedaleopsis nitida]|nr:hypothetical protein C8Q80DRAFT_519539 [Daedaleopsis nitida]
MQTATGGAAQIDQDLDVSRKHPGRAAIAGRDSRGEGGPLLAVADRRYVVASTGEKGDGCSRLSAYWQYQYSALDQAGLGTSSAPSILAIFLPQSELALRVTQTDWLRTPERASCRHAASAMLRPHMHSSSLRRRSTVPLRTSGGSVRGCQWGRKRLSASSGTARATDADADASTSKRSMSTDGESECESVQYRSHKAEWTVGEGRTSRRSHTWCLRATSRTWPAVTALTSGRQGSQAPTGAARPFVLRSTFLRSGTGVCAAAA